MMEEVMDEFVIPLDIDELLQTRHGKYGVKDVVQPTALGQALNAVRPALQEDGAKFIFQHFDTFFSILVHGNKVHFPFATRAFGSILKGTNLLIDDMEALFQGGKDVDVNQRVQYLSMNRMYAYLLSSLSCYIEDYVDKESEKENVMGKKKKGMKKSEAEDYWEDNREKALHCIYRWLELPIQKLWTPPIVESMFITLHTEFCYKVLDKNKYAKRKQVVETIFEILGTLVKRYNHGIICSVRIIQLIKMHDNLSAPMATGVLHMVTKTDNAGFIKALLKEIDQNEPTDADSRNIASFLETISSLRPDVFLPLLDYIMDYLTIENYLMRNCALTVLGEVVLGSLTEEELHETKREQRDDCLHHLQEHILDSNAYTRVKTLQVWQRLCCEGAVPLQKQGCLLKAASMRLEDKSALVRKQALQLLRALLQGNPFAAKLDQATFSRQLDEARTKLQEIKVSVASHSTRGDAARLELWKDLLPEIREAIKKVVTPESENENSSDEEHEKSKKDNEVDENHAFEEVRHLLLAKKVFPAVTYLQKICKTLPNVPDMSGMKLEEKENCFFLFLLKIFMESESDVSTQSESTDAPETSTSEALHAIKRKELKEYQEELTKRRRLVKYLENCLYFARQLDQAILWAENLLFSTTASDAIEACTFLGTASQFGVQQALDGVRKALFQVASRDESVRNNVAEVYKTIYLENSTTKQSSRQKALTSVKGLIELFKGLSAGQSTALTQLVVTWRNNKEIGPEEIQVMWEKFSMKIPETTPEESRAALVLLTMVATTEVGLLISNLDVLIKIGLGPRARNDLLLARDVCRALKKITQVSEDCNKSPLKYTNDHIMFQEILDLIINNFLSTKDDGYISFVTEGINVIYQLANQPDTLIMRMITSIAEKSNLLAPPRRRSGEPVQDRLSQAPSPNFHLLSRLFYIIGHIAIRHMVYLDNAVYKELRRRNAIRQLKTKKNKPFNTSSQLATPSTNNTSKQYLSTPASARLQNRQKETPNSTLNTDENGEEVLEGATADDADAEFVTAALENDIVTGKGMLARFIPLILEICRHPEKYNDEKLQAYSVLALSKMMTVSSQFCVASLQLLVTIMDRSPHPGIRANVVVAMCDLTMRFPNQVEPWTSHIYSRLRDEDVNVRRTCVKMLSSLIMREMIRVKGQISSLARNIMDPDETIRSDTKLFFKDLSHKGNALYNAMPDILSGLTDPELKIKEDDFQEIIKYLLSLMGKERQIDTLIEKLCSRFILATSERQWRDLAYCLSRLQFSVKSISNLTQKLSLLKDKIHQKEVLKALRIIIEQTRKKPATKEASLQLEAKLEELLKTTNGSDGEVDDDRQAMPPPPVPKARKQTRRTKPRKSSSSSSSSEDDDKDDSKAENISVNDGKKNATLTNRKADGSESSLHVSSDSDSNEESPPTEGTPKAKRGRSKLTKRKPPKSAATPRSSVKRHRQVDERLSNSSTETTPHRTSGRIRRTPSKY